MTFIKQLDSWFDDERNAQIKAKLDEEQRKKFDELLLQGYRVVTKGFNSSGYFINVTNGKETVTI